MTDWEAWLKVVEAPEDGSVLQAPPLLVLSLDGTRYRCGRCGTVLLVARFGEANGFVVRCANCGRYNEVTI